MSEAIEGLALLVRNGLASACRVLGMGWLSLPEQTPSLGVNTFSELSKMHGQATRVAPLTLPLSGQAVSSNAKMFAPPPEDHRP